MPDLITSKTNIRYLSNFTGSSGFMLITKAKKYLFTDFRYIERAKNSIKKGIQIIDTTKMWRNPKELKENWQKILKKHKIKVLGIEESNLSIEKYKKFKKISPKVKFKDISDHYKKIREIKTNEEVVNIIKSQRINEKVFKEIEKLIKSRKPITEIQIAWKIKELGYKYGADDISFDPIVGFGKNSSIVHHEPGKTKLKKNDIVLIDMGMKYKGYCSDMTRMIMPKTPTDLQKKIYTTVLEAQTAGIKAIRAGMTGAKADKIVRDIIVKAGYGEQYGHAGGHGVGLDIHEIPALSEKYKKTLRENSVITIEPGIYLEGKFGVRIEDMVIVTKNGNKNLTKIEK